MHPFKWERCKRSGPILDTLWCTQSNSGAFFPRNLRKTVCIELIDICSKDCALSYLGHRGEKFEKSFMLHNLMLHTEDLKAHCNRARQCIYCSSMCTAINTSSKNNTRDAIVCYSMASRSPTARTHMITFAEL